jgi:signal transduction histidine kinase
LLLNWFGNRARARPAVLLGLAAFAPLAIYAAFDGYVALARGHASLAEQSLATARTLAETVDRQINAGIEDAQTLAGAPALDHTPQAPADLAVFKEVAQRYRERHSDWQTVVLLTPDGRFLYSTDSPDDAGSRVAEDMTSLKQAVATGVPVAGDLVKGAHGRWGIPLRAPVVRGGKVVSVVTVVLNPAVVQRSVSSLRLPAPWIAAVVNAQGHVVARAPDIGGVTMGRAVNAEGRAARARGGGGDYHGRLLDGSMSQTFYWVSPQSHWSAHVVVARSVYEAPLRRMLLTMAAGFVICLLLAAVLVLLWIRDYESRRGHAAAVEQATRVDALGRLTGGVAHDFNNLLTVIQGNTEILGRRLQGNAQAERPLTSIRAATDRATKLTRQLLVFARGGPAESAAVDLARKLTDLIGPMSQLVGAGVAIETDLEPGLPPVNVDPLQLEAAMLNLAANARDAMSGSGRLVIRLRRSGPWIVLSMRDEGSGFDPAVVARVFDPFFTTKPVGEGTGLGLSQVYGLVKGAGGAVEAANAPGGGGLVTLSFPPADRPAADEEPAAAPFQRQLPVVGLPSILLVDDNEAVRATTAAYLREGGLSVIEAPDAVHALQALETARVEAVVSDIVMPGEDGMSLAEKIRTRWPGLPVVLVSGFSERAADAQARGFTVINKPYGLADLERRVRDLVERAAAAGA